MIATSATERRKETVYYNAVDAAALLGVSPSTIRAWIKKGYIRNDGTGAIYKIPKSEIERMKKGEGLSHVQMLYTRTVCNTHDDQEIVRLCLDCDVPAGCQPESPMCKRRKALRARGVKGRIH